ncbi:MAG: hypothetical protein QW757_02825 [Candidatus Woesearchaeota archaeon]
MDQLKKKTFLFAVFESKLCFIVFLLSLALGSILTPKRIFYGYFTILGVFYIFLFALVMTCMVRIIKEKVINLKHTGASFFSIILSLLGFSALNVCGIGAPVCGAGLTIGIASFFPSFFNNFFHNYAWLILIISIIIQILALWYMGCFKKCFC